MSKKTLALILALCMMLAMVAGCSSKPASTPETNGDNNTTATTPQTPADNTDNAAEEDSTVIEGADGEQVGYRSSAVTGEITGITGAQLPEGTEASITWQWDVLDGFNYVNLPLAESLQTITAFASWQNDFIQDPNQASNMQELERRTNVHVDWTTVSGAAAIEQYSMMFASGDWDDIIFDGQNYTGGATAALENEVYLEISDIVAEHCPNYTKAMSLGEEFRKATHTNDGDLAGFYMMEYSLEPAWYGVVVYQHLLDQYGLETPVTLADWENMMTVAMQNGQSYGYGMMPVSGTVNNPYTVLTAYDTYGSFYQVDGTIHYGPIEDAYRDALYKLKEWHQKGYLGPDWYGYSDSSSFYNQILFDAFGKEECIAADGMSGCLGVTAMKGFGNVNPDMNVVALPNPVLNEGDTNHFRQLVPQVRDVFAAISTSAADPVLCAKWLDYRLSNEGKNLWTYGVEGETYEVNPDGTITQAQVILDARNSQGENYDEAREAVANLLFWNATGCWYEWRAGISHYTEQQFEEKWLGYDWTEASPADYMLPLYGILAEDLVDGYSSILADITTYVNEMYVKFIIGEASLDTQWEEYVSRIETMNIQFCIEAQQRALDAYIAR